MMYKGKYTGEELEKRLDEASKYALFDDMWEAADGTIVDKEKHIYGLNGLNDITYQQGVAILERANFTSLHNSVLTGAEIKNCRTNFAPAVNQGTIALNNFRVDSTFEILALTPSKLSWFLCNNFTGFLDNAPSLREIIGIIRVSSVTNFGAAYLGCPVLTYLMIAMLQCNLNLSRCPLLSLESFQYLVTNAANTADITVTVHPDVYAKMTDEGNAEWNKVFTDAVARKIAFATV